jgi:GNAT superfamily N-acetyltransferase
MQASDYNFMHSIGVFAASSKGGEVFENRDLLLTNTKAPFAEFNQCFMKRPSYKFERACDVAQAHFAAAKVPFRLQFSAEFPAAARELERRGFVAAAPAPGMLLEGGGPLAWQVPGLRVEQVAGVEALSHFQRVAFESFGYPAHFGPLALTDELLALPHVSLFVGYFDDQPACTSALLITAGRAGIYWVGTLAKFRKRGLGAAITAHAAQAGFAHGCRAASLQASPMGAPVYRRMGFITEREYLRYDSAPSAARVT